jgi:hypothetical protein
MANDYTAKMPPKLNQDRRTARAVGHQVANTRRDGPMLKAGGQKNVGVQPEPHSSPTMPAEENGFAPDGPLPANPNDAQSQQTTAPPISDDIAGPPPVATTDDPPEEPTESESVPEGEIGPTGGATKPKYSPLIEEAHPIGYSGE